MTVGDARTFQGKERDIMLMSMVATPDQKVTATSSVYAQRFNVAASRARDRMYLVRSVQASDLNKSDLKAKLIGHFASPFREDPIKVATMRDLCESGFERQMFDVLFGASYRVRPQVKVGGYSIDLVESKSDLERLLQAFVDHKRDLPQFGMFDHLSPERLIGLERIATRP